MEPPGGVAGQRSVRFQIVPEMLGGRVRASSGSTVGPLARYTRRNVGSKRSRVSLRYRMTELENGTPWNRNADASRYGYGCRAGARRARGTKLWRVSLRGNTTKRLCVSLGRAERRRPRSGSTVRSLRRGFRGGAKGRRGRGRDCGDRRGRRVARGRTLRPCRRLRACRPRRWRCGRRA